MTSLLLYFVVIATVITSIVNAVKPGYKKFAGKYTVTINTLLSFWLGILASFSVAPYLDLELNNGLLILLWLALGTGSGIFYDVWALLQNAWDKIKKSLE